MTLRRRLKYLYYRRLGRFPYYGETLHFPPDSVVFAEACMQGIYEHANLWLLQCAVRPGGWYFDIGANIGLMSAPLLSAEPTLQVVSVEASPITAPLLQQSAAVSRHRDRWHVVPLALGDAPGRIAFHASSAGGGAFDGIRDTGRSGGAASVEVEMTTLDLLWEKFGRPPVCLLKLDIEGGETFVLRGARACLAATRPVILLEWNPLNLRAYGLVPESLVELADGLDYDVLTTPGLAPVRDASQLPYLSRANETFLLLPRGRSA